MTDQTPDHALPLDLSAIGDSLIHVGGDDLQALLAAFSTEDRQLSFTDGRLQAKVNGLTLEVYELRLGPEGFDLRLRLASREG